MDTNELLLLQLVPHGLFMKTKMNTTGAWQERFAELTSERRNAEKYGEFT